MANHSTGPQPQGGARGQERYIIVREGQPFPPGPLQSALGRLQEYMQNMGDRTLPDVLGFLSETTSLLNYVQQTVLERQRNITADQDEHRGLRGTLPQEFEKTRADVRLLDIPRFRSVLAELAGPGNHKSRLWNPQTQTWSEASIPELGGENTQEILLGEITTLRKDLAAYRAQEAHTDPKFHITIDLVQMGSPREVKSTRTFREEAQAHQAPTYVNEPRQRAFYMIIRIPGKDPKTEYALVFSPHTLGAVYLYPANPHAQEHVSPYFRDGLIKLQEESYNPQTGEGLVVVPNADEEFVQPSMRRGLRTLAQRFRGQPVPDLIEDLFNNPLFHGDPVMDGRDIYKERWIRADHFDLSFT